MDKDTLDFAGEKGIHIVHMNVRSLGDTKKLDMLKLQLSRSRAHIIGISETWLKEDIPSCLLGMEGYTLSRLDRAWLGDDGRVKKGGGVAVYYDCKLQISEHKYAHLNISSKNIELQWISMDNDNLRQIIILNAYRPPQGDYKVFCKELLERITAADIRANAEIFLMGDFNIDFHDKKSKEFSELNTVTKALGLKQHIKSTTRYGAARNSCLDLIFSNSDCIKRQGVVNINISDHLPVFVSRKKMRAKSVKISFTGRSYRWYNKEAFQANLLDFNWAHFYRQDNPNAAWGVMKSVIEKEINYMCPCKTYRVKKYDDPWITREIIELIRDKDNLLRAAKISGDEEDWAVARKARNVVSGQLRNLKADFLKEEQRNNFDDPKKFWKNISAVLPNGKKDEREIVLSEGNQKLKLEESATRINEYFTTIGPSLAGEYDPEKWHPITGREETNLAECVVNHEAVLKLCKEIKISKSSGYNHLSAKILKDSFLALTPQLVFLFRLSLNTATFPDDWKVATIVPLHKGGPPDVVGNYRPVSLLPLPGKLLEKIVHAHISGFVESNKLISDFQGGFRKNRSTTSTIVSLTDSILRAMNVGKVTLATFIDLRKAFDTINHKVLLRKLEHIGIRGKMLSWCASYLENREQSTIANNIKSCPLGVTCGVPQGSVLGPMFFLMYINDMVDYVNGVNVNLYADDTVLYIEGKDISDCKGLLQNALTKFTDWCEANALHINKGKTKVMVFGTSRRIKRLGKVDLELGGTVLSQVPSYKYLGITLDSTLSLKQHLSNVTRTVSHKIYVLSRVRKYLSDRAALLVYKSMVLPYLDYGDIVYSKACASELERLQRLQNRALKLCLRVTRFEETETIHRRTKVPLLCNRRKEHLLSYMYKQKDLGHGLEKSVRGTRSADAPKFVLPSPNLQCYKGSIEYSGAKAWNSLPKPLKLIPNYLSFKNKIHKELLNTVN